MEGLRLVTAVPANWWSMSLSTETRPAEHIGCVESVSTEWADGPESRHTARSHGRRRRKKEERKKEKEVPAL